LNLFTLTDTYISITEVPIFRTRYNSSFHFVRLKQTNYHLGAGVAFGPNAQRALEIIGVSDALDRVSQSSKDPGLDTNIWYLPELYICVYFNIVPLDIGSPLRLARHSML
jgi:hypothetical protein